MIRGEIWLAETRPVLIVQDDAFNKSNIKTIAVLPLTTNVRLQEAPGNVLLKRKESKLQNDSVILVTQLYAVDRRRFKERVSKVTGEIMEQVEIGMKLVLGIKR
jgi:mRNA interferase MazF